MRSTIYFNGQSSADYGLVVEYFPESVHAARRGDLIPIPGRNGVIIREDGAYDTYTQTYQIWFRNTMNRDTYQNARDVAVWLLGTSGFCRLEDTYEPEYFKLARFVGPLNIETVLKNHGRATLEFEVQPQRFLKSGEIPEQFSLTSETTILNHTLFESRPLLKFTDTSEVPPYVEVSPVLVENMWIVRDGKWSRAVDYSGMYTTQKIDVQGKDMVRMICNGYTFLDENEKSRENYYVPTGGFPVGSPTGATVDNYWSVPDWARWVVASKGDGQSVRVWTKAKQAHPGASVVTINDVTVNLDFADHSTIYLDCDLHDAYYAGGENANQMVSFSSDVTAYPTFPGLMPGVNTVTVNSGQVELELTPRWWTL